MTGLCMGFSWKKGFELQERYPRATLAIRSLIEERRLAAALPVERRISPA